MKGNKKRRARKSSPVQNEFKFPAGHGGARKGAGRKKSPNSGVSHDRRDDFTERFPVHVTMKLIEELPNLRDKNNLLALLEMLQAAQKEDFRIERRGLVSKEKIEQVFLDALLKGGALRLPPSPDQPFILKSGRPSPPLFLIGSVDRGIS